MPASFPGIFDIKIQSGSACARTPVFAIVNAAYPNCNNGPTTGIDPGTSVSQNILVYPNPSAESFTLKGPSIISANIYDATGRLVEKTSPALEQQFGQSLQAGIYFIETLKIIKY